MLIAAFGIAEVESASAQDAPPQPSVAIRRNADLGPRSIPADFNGDGITDLATSFRWSAFDGRLAIVLGRAGGSSSGPVVTATKGRALAVADMNKDGKLDVIAAPPGTNVEAFIRHGNGDGTLGPHLPIARFHSPEFAVVGDFDGDTNPDLVIGSYPNTVRIIPGRGDRTFGEAVALPPPAGATPSSAAAGDVDGDGDLDLYVSNAQPYTVTEYINDGSFAFRVRELSFAGRTSAAALADVNGDGHLDLLVAVTRPADDGESWTGGSTVEVMLGSGDGTFGAPAAYETGAGAWRLQLGDFNRDGRIDVATANHAFRWFENCGGDDYGMATVSVLPGLGNGTFGRGSTFALGDQAHPDTYTGRAFALDSGDVDGDGHVDLLAADGDILLTRPPDPNWAPTVGAGPDSTVTEGEFVRLLASVDEPDLDDVSYRWTHSGGLGVPPVANPCLASLPPGTHTFTVTVDDGHGHTATDAVTVTVSPYAEPAPEDPPSVENWASGDVGAVGAAGGMSYSQGTYTVTGSGADVWGTQDELHFAYTQVTGDFDFFARVASVQNLDRWVKAGLMVREHTGAGARHAFALATPRAERGLAFQRRPAEGGATLHTSGPLVAPPRILWLRRTGNLIEAFYQQSEGSWSLLGREEFTGLAGTLLVGFGVSSHVDGTLATATFDHVSLLRHEANWTPGWIQADVGAVGAPGWSMFLRPGFSVNGSGADVWGTADEFHYVYRPLDGDFDLSAQVTNVQNLDKWVKAGLMIRESLDPGARHAFAISTPRTERGLAFQRRPTAGGLTLNTAGPALSPSVWLKVSRRGDVITAYYKKAINDSWVQLGTQTYSGLPARLLAGMAVSSHVDGTTAYAGFWVVSVNPAK